MKRLLTRKAIFHFHYYLPLGIQIGFYYTATLKGKRFR